MKKSEIYTHDAPRYVDANTLKNNPEKAAADINKTLKDLWQRNIGYKVRIDKLEEQIESLMNARPPIRYKI